MPAPLDAWLAHGDAPEADWGPYVLGLAVRGDLAVLDDGLVLDVAALDRPFACRPLACSPDTRGPRARSCCADVEVTLTPDERDAILAALPEVAGWMASRDPRWEAGAPEVLDGDALRRPERRCVFALRSPRGLRCGLHQVEDATGRARGSLKPMPCRLFPLVVVDLGEGRRLLTAVGPGTARRVGLPGARAFPCLRGDRALPLYRSLRDTLSEVWGEAGYREIRRAVVRWRRHRAPAR